MSKHSRVEMRTERPTELQIVPEAEVEEREI